MRADSSCAINFNMGKFYIGVDIGGSFTKAGLVQDGKIIYKTKVPTKKGTLDSVLCVCDEIISKHNDTFISGIGVAIAGMVYKGRILLSAANLGLSHIDVADRLENKYRIPTKIGNDIACFALAEAAKSKIDNLVYIALGTGVNVGVINKGNLFSGADGVSLEYGHTSFAREENAQPCACGLDGCVEQFVSGTALMMMAKEKGIAASTPEEVFAVSEEIATEFLSCLLTMLVNIANTYRPQMIFIGGGLAAMVKPHINELNAGLKEKNYGYKNAPAVTVAISKLSTDGAVIGAASLG